MFRFKTIRLKKQDLIPDLESCKKVISFGASSFITQFALVIVMTVVNNVLVRYGARSKYGADIPLAVLGIDMKVNQLLISIVIGIATGTQPIWGYDYGSDHQHFRTRIGSLSGICGKVFPDISVSLFPDPGGRCDRYLFSVDRKTGPGGGHFLMPPDHPPDPGSAGI